MSVFPLTGSPRFERGGLLALAAGFGVAEVILAAALVTKPIPVVAMTLGMAAFVLALWQPRTVYAVVLVTLAFVPVYASPKLGPLSLEPTVAGMWLVAGAVALRALALGRRLSFGVIDAAVLLLFVLLFLTTAFGTTERGEILQIAFLWLGPYVATRLILEHEGGGRMLLISIAVAALLSLPLAVLERATGENPFFALSLGGTSAPVWGISQERLGETRAEGAFGHSIALAMFLATAALACVGLALNAVRTRVRLLWWCAAAAVAGAMVFTLSRTGWLVAMSGAVILVLLTTGKARLRLGAALVGALVIALTWSNLPGEAMSPLEIVTSSSSDTAIANSSNYRLDLLKAVARPDAFEVWGPADVPFGFLTYDGRASVDNGYLAFASSWGIVPTTGLLLVVLAVVLSVLRLRGTGLPTVIAAITLANFLALLVVAFITQQQVYIWALVGACASLTAHGADRPPASGSRSQPASIEPIEARPEYTDRSTRSG